MEQVQVTLTGSEHWLIASLLPDRGNPMVINYVNQLAPFANEENDDAADIAVSVEGSLVAYAFRQLAESQECIVKENPVIQGKLMSQLSQQDCPELLQELGLLNAEFIRRKNEKRAEGKAFCSRIIPPVAATAA